MFNFLAGDIHMKKSILTSFLASLAMTALVLSAPAFACDGDKAKAGCTCGSGCDCAKGGEACNCQGKKADEHKACAEGKKCEGTACDSADKAKEGEKK